MFCNSTITDLFLFVFTQLILHYRKYGSYAKRLWAEHNVVLEMAEDDLEVLAKGKVDIYTFSYYMSTVVTTHQSEDSVSGNFSAGAKNPYLTYSD